MHTFPVKFARFITPALRTVGNIVSGDDKSTQVRFVMWSFFFRSLWEKPFNAFNFLFYCTNLICSEAHHKPRHTSCSQGNLVLQCHHPSCTYLAFVVSLQIEMFIYIIYFWQDLLSHQKEAIRKEACWAFSNVFAGNSKQIQVRWTSIQILALL